MGNRLFNNYNLTNEEIEKIIINFEPDIKIAIKKLIGHSNQDYEQIIRFEIFKTLSRNRKK